MFSENINHNCKTNSSVCANNIAFTLKITFLTLKMDFLSKTAINYFLSPFYILLFILYSFFISIRLLFFYFLCFLYITMYTLNITKAIKKTSVYEIRDFIFETFYKKIGNSKENNYYSIKCFEIRICCCFRTS